MAESIEHVRPDRYLIDAVLAQLARVDRSRVAVRRARATRQVVLNLVLVLVLVGAALALLARVSEPDADAAPVFVLLLAGFTASSGSVAALMLVFAARLTGDARGTWLGLVVGWYSLLAIPLWTIRGLVDGPDPTAAAGLLVVSATAVGLWVLVLVAPLPPTATRLLVGLTGVVVLAGAGTALGAGLAPALVQAVAGGRAWGLASALVWIVGGLIVVARATVGRAPGLVVVGEGLAMLGADQAGRFVGPLPGAETTPLFAVLHVAAVTMVLGGSLWILRRALLRLNVEQAVHEKELRRAELALAGAAERDHDLRNGLAGLAGATAVLGGGAGTGQLSQVVAGELRRLEHMLQGSTEGEPRGAYAVAPAIDGLVLLRRSAGMDVRADVEPGLHVLGSPGTLAQVVTNLLANAERHAPGSPVRIAAVRRGHEVEIRVRDFGPGIPAGRERAVLEPGRRDERAGGLGLGLHVCRTLLAAEDATIEILPADPSSPGAVVVLGLAAGERASSGGRRVARDETHATT